MYRFYAPRSDFHEGRVTLAADETHHLRDVLRQTAGDEVQVFDGEGNEYLCRIETLAKKETVLTIIENTTPADSGSALDLTLAAAILQADKFELIIQKAVELGVTTFVPLQCIRCEVRVRDADKKLLRWRRIALDAAKQCGRATNMIIGDITSSVDFIGQRETSDSLQILFAERAGERFETLESGQKIVAMIGPKGGWEESEMVEARSNGFKVLTLGGRIMRAETAAISIVAILQHRFGDLN